MSEYDFQLQVVADLAEIKTHNAASEQNTAEIKEHLRTLNGKVAAHEKILNERTNQCPLVDAIEVRIRPLEAFMISEQAADRTSKTWLDRLWPLVWAAAGAIAILLLGHGEDLLKHISK